MAQVFVSYGSADRAFAQELASALVARGLSVWWDRDMRGGADFGEVIAAEIASSTLVLVLWSEASIKSHWVRDEAAEGLRRGALLPVLIEATTPPMGFRSVHTRSLIGWKGDASAPEFRALQSDIISRIGLPQVDEHGDLVRARSQVAGGRRRLELALAAVAVLVGAGGAALTWRTNEGGSRLGRSGVSETTVAQIQGATGLVATTPEQSPQDFKPDRPSPNKGQASLTRAASDAEARSPNARAPVVSSSAPTSGVPPAMTARSGSGVANAAEIASKPEGPIAAEPDLKREALMPSSASVGSVDIRSIRCARDAAQDRWVVEVYGTVSGGVGDYLRVGLVGSGAKRFAPISAAANECGEWSSAPVPGTSGSFLQCGRLPTSAAQTNWTRRLEGSSVSGDLFVSAEYVYRDFGRQDQSRATNRRVTCE